jgi:hypothetical protein
MTAVTDWAERQLPWDGVALHWLTMPCAWAKFD